MERFILKRVHDMNIYQIIITLAAIWGAGLSTYIAIRSFKKEKPQIRVNLSYGSFVNGSRETPVFFLAAANIGNHTVTLSSYGISLPSKESLFFLGPDGLQKFPYELLPGREFSIQIKKSSIINNLKSQSSKGIIKISGFYIDDVHNYYTSKSLKFQI